MGMSMMAGDTGRLNAYGAEMRRLWAVGTAGRATIMSVRDTGERLVGNAVVELGLEVVLEHGAPYRVLVRMPVGGEDLRPYRPGTRYTVKVDPRDPAKLAFSA